MARGARLVSESGYYHVMARGNNKEMIFKHPSEKQYYLDGLKEAIGEGNFKLLSYCIMDNHIHLLLNSDINSMATAFRRINLKFALRYNKKYDRVGHVFQGRYKSEAVETDQYLLAAIRYIHNNPVKAKIVGRAEGYKWSSYRGYLDGQDNLLDSKEKEMIRDMFRGSLEQFRRFHLEDDMLEFLDTKEDLDREREDRARRILKSYRQEYGVEDIKELSHRKETIDKIVTDLLELSKLPHRRIANLLAINRGVVHNIAKKT